MIFVLNLIWFFRHLIFQMLDNMGGNAASNSLQYSVFDTDMNNIMLVDLHSLHKITANHKWHHLSAHVLSFIEPRLLGFLMAVLSLYQTNTESAGL